MCSDFLSGIGLRFIVLIEPYFRLAENRCLIFLSWIALGVIVGGRAGYMFFYQPDRLLDDPCHYFMYGRWDGFPWRVDWSDSANLDFCSEASGRATCSR